MNINYLSQIYTCPLCLELDNTAVSFKSCGHEFHEACAQKIKDTTKQCSICRVEVNDTNPAYTTREAVAAILKHLENTAPKNLIKFTIHLSTEAPEKTFDVHASKDGRVAKLFGEIFKLKEISPTGYDLLYNQKRLSPFSKIADFVEPFAKKQELFLKPHSDNCEYNEGRLYEEALKRSEDNLDESNIISNYKLIYSKAIEQAIIEEEQIHQ